MIEVRIVPIPDSQLLTVAETEQEIAEGRSGGFLIQVDDGSDVRMVALAGLLRLIRRLEDRCTTLEGRVAELEERVP